MNIALDTNIIVYAYDLRDRAKSDTCDRICQHWLGYARSYLALQVITELANVLHRRLVMPPEEIAVIVNTYSDGAVNFAYNLTDILTASALASGGMMSFWDGVLVNAAARAGVTHLVSEDMQAGFHYQGLDIISPFAADMTPNRDLINWLTT